MSKRRLIVVVVAACSSNSSDTCAVDGDCEAGTVCELRDAQPSCVAVGEATIRIGQGLALTGVQQGEGLAVKQGVELAFAEENAAGGIRGRAVDIQFSDDGFVPEVAEQDARDMLDVQVSPTEPPQCPSTAAISDTAITRGPNAVLALLGNVGSPAVQSAAPVAIETGTVYFGGVTGTTALLRDTATGACARSIFNVRASYTEEVRATVELFHAKGIADAAQLMSFDQDDSFGQDGYDGLVVAFQDVVGPFPAGSDPTTPIVRFRYTRNDDTSVPAQAQAATDYLTQLLTNRAGPITVGIMMTDTYGAAAAFITAVRQWQYDGAQAGLQKDTRLTLLLSNVSFVESNSLSDRLVAAGTVQTPAGAKPYTDAVYVSQVVPNYQTDTSALVQAYTSGVSTPSFLSLEGYLLARVFLAGLAAHDGPFTADSLATTLEQPLDVGLTGTFGFAADHQYSHSVWGTALQPDGTFRDAYRWTSGSPIVVLE